MMNATLYPPSVHGAPADLTVPSPAYRRQVVIVLLCLVLFVLFYMGLIAGSGWIVYYGIAQLVTALADGSGHSQVELYFGVAGVGCVLLLFLIKSLFKWRKDERDLRLEITRSEHPELFDFLTRLCGEIGAPKPYKVFLTPEVNAAVFYNSSLLSLIMPVKKNLLIGIGLINGLTLSEFKAVLAHEFGHFSQSSMRLGSYVYMANHIIYDIVYERDKLDDMLAKARRTNYRIAAFAYLISGILWVLRMVLQGVFRLINIFESALSRQMEFHADLVAVSVTGSDSLIHALKKLEFLNSCLMHTFHDLRDASDHQVYTEDIYYHQSRAAEHVRRILHAPDAGMVPALPDDPRQKTQLFSIADSTSDADRMWASHPCGYDREKNAKRRYLRSNEDDRSPWLLFRNPDALRRRMTEKFYRHVLELENPTFAQPDQVQQFIDDEHAETDQDDRYHGMYDGRLLAIPLDALPEYANDPALAAMSLEQIRDGLQRLYNAEYRDRLDAHTRRREETALLEAIDAGQARVRGPRFEFRGVQRAKSDVRLLLKMLEAEMEKDGEWFTAFDRDVFQTHYRLAQITNTGPDELYTRYEFHLNLQGILRIGQNEEARMANLFTFLSGKTSGLSDSEFGTAVATLKEAHTAIDAALRKAQTALLPPLQNMQPGIPLSDSLLQEPLAPPMVDGSVIDGDWAALLAKHVSELATRSLRLYFKSMGAILSLQESIAAAFAPELLASPPAPAAPTPPASP